MINGGRLNESSADRDFDNSSKENSQTELIEALQLQIAQLGTENLAQKNTISVLQRRVSILEDELDDCEKDILENEDENSKLKKQIQALMIHNRSLLDTNQKMLSYYQSTGNRYSLMRRIPFLASNHIDATDKPDDEVKSVSQVRL